MADKTATGPFLMRSMMGTMMHCGELASHLPGILLRARANGWLDPDADIAELVHEYIDADLGRAGYPRDVRDEILDTLVPAVVEQINQIKQAQDSNRSSEVTPWRRR